jgi:hypothetical protein
VSRKSKLQRTRSDELDKRLQGCYRQGADEEFIELVHDRPADACRCAAAGLYGEVVDRALRRALAAGDLAASERICQRLLREARARPLALAAAAAGHLAAGRREEAGLALAELAAAGGDGTPLGPALAALATLAGPCPPGAPAADGGALDTPEAQAVWSFYRGLQALAAGGPAPATAEIAALARSLDSLRAALGGDRALADLLADADKCLHLLAVVASAERVVRRPRGGGRQEAGAPGGTGSFLKVAREVAKPLLAVLRADAWPPLLEPLRHALRERWRSLLSWLAEQPDAAAVWAELYSISPPLFALDLETAGGSSLESGAQALRRWIQGRSLLSAKSLGELARWLSLAAKSEPEPGRLVRLWALELWAWDQEEAAEDPGDPVGVAPGARPLMSALLRLEPMAAQCRNRIPAEQQREVARWLADQLVDLCQGVRFCRSMAVTAESLLAHLPDDPGLLVVGLAAAACSANLDAGKRFGSRIAARGVAGGADQEKILGLVSEIAIEETKVAAPVLRQLRPLLPDEAWPRVQSLMAQEMAEGILTSYRFDLDLDFRRLRRELDLCSDTLGECPELTALVAAVDCIDPAGRGASRALGRVLGDLSGLEPALIAFRVVAAASAHGARQVEEAFQDARRVTLDRLDERWRLWRPVLVPLVIGADRRQRQHLKAMLTRLRGRQEVNEIDRQAYGEILSEIDLAVRLERQTWRQLGRELSFDTTGPEAGRPQAQGTGARRRSRPKAAADDQLSIDF